MPTESFFTQASLAYLASAGAGKDGKTYSMKPTDGTGDFTFSRGSNLAATRVGADGLIEKGRENLFLQSNQFDTTWTNNNTTETGGQTGYDGSSDAWLLEKSAISLAYINQNVSASGVYTISVYAKAGTLDTMNFFISAAKRVQFNLGNGTIDSSSSGVVDYKIEAVSGATGWYRCSATFADATTYVRIYPQWTETTSGSIYIQDAQLEIGLAATEVIESGATTGKAGLLEDEPRFDYSGDCPSLLLEPSRTQLITQSEYLGSIFTGNRMSITDLVDTSPEGLVNASKLTPDTTPNSTHQSNTSNYGSFVSGDKITISIFAKADGFDGIILRFLNESGAFTTNRIAKFDLSRGRWENDSMDGTTGVMSGEVGMEALGNGWYRCFATATADSAGDVDIRIPVADVTAEDVYDEVFTGDGTKGVLIYGLQLEQGSYPTSYIPNHSGGTITRGADDCFGAGDASTFNSTEGVLYAEISALADDGSSKAISLFKDTDNRIQIVYASGNSVQVFCKMQASAFILYASVTDQTIANKIAFKYKENDFALWVNGVEADTNTSNPTSLSGTLDTLSFKMFNNGAPFYGNAKQVLVFNTALSDADLATLTTI